MLDAEFFLLGIATASGKSASVEFITGTAENPWGDLDVAALSRDIATNNASVKMALTMDDATVRNYVYTSSDSNQLIVSAAYYRDSPLAINEAYHFAWNAANGQPIHAYLTRGGVSTNLTAYASVVTTVLIVIRHPLS